MTISEFQRLVENIYYEKDNQRGMEATFMWFVEEVGELSEALRSGNKDELRTEFADAAAWLATLASIADVELEEAVQWQYADGCPKCGQTPCVCECD